MGKKNKKRNVESSDKSTTVQPKGGSVISKNKSISPKSPTNASQKKSENKKKIKELNKQNKPVEIKQKVTEEKAQEIASKIGGKKKRKRNKKNKTANGESNVSSEAIVESQNKAVNGEKSPATDEVKLNKRSKNRVKSVMKKEIARDGKSKLGLADPKLVSKRLKKLKEKPEPRSKATLRKILLLEKLLEKLKKDGKDNKKDKKKSPVKHKKDKPDSSEDEEMESDDSSDKDNKEQKESIKKTTSQNTTKTVTQVKVGKKKKDRFCLFVGNLPKDITDEAIKEHFEVAGQLQSVKIPVPKHKKNKPFAYVQFVDGESQRKGLELHGTMLGEKKINVLYADKSKGKSNLMSKNAKLNIMRKAKETPAQINISPKSKNKKKTKKVKVMKEK